MPKATTAREVCSSQEALACGEAFQKVAEKLIPAIWTVKEGATQIIPDELGEVVACATNLAFAIELYLKGLLVQLGLDVPKLHDLEFLYGAIPQSDRTLIESIYDVALPEEVRRLNGHVSFTLAKGAPESPWRNDYGASLALPDLLARSKNIFQSWRYVFEFSQPEGSSYQFHQFEYGLLRCAAEVLRVELTVRLQGTGAQPLPNALLGES
jgi:hypothetical protein